MCCKKKNDKSEKRTKNFAMNSDVVDTTSKQCGVVNLRTTADCNQLFSFCA